MMTSFSSLINKMNRGGLHSDRPSQFKPYSLPILIFLVNTDQLPLLVDRPVICPLDRSRAVGYDTAADS